jgi:sugar diacid utilization regulator
MSTTVEKGTEARPALQRALSAFAKVTAAVEDSTQLDDLLLVVAAQISEMVGVGRCSIHLRDERVGLYVGCVCHADGRSAGTDIKRSRAGCPADGMTRELLRTHRPVIVENAEKDPRAVQSTVRFWRIRSVMAVPMLYGDEVIGVLFLDDEAASHAFSAADAELALTFAELAAVAVMHAQKRAELRAEVDAGQRHIRALQRATAVDERLSDLVLAGRPLRDLLVTLAELLGKPCAVFDREGNRLAGAVPPGVEEGVGPRLLEAPFGKHPDVVAAMASHDGSRAFIVGPLPHAGIAHRHVVAPVVLDGVPWGDLVVMEYSARFVGSDMLTLRRAATLVALQVSVDRRAVEADWDAGASLAAALLTSDSEHTIVQRRADHLGVRLDQPRVVMVLAGRPGGVTLPDVRAVAGAFAELAPELASHLTAVPAGIAVLAGTRDDERGDELRALAEQALRRVCARIGSSAGMVGGLSNVHSDAAGYRAAYTEAQRVAECLLRFGRRGGPTVSSTSELGGGLVFLATADREAVVHFAEQTLGWLVDDPSMSDLLDTLCSFFDNVASIRRCATSLGVHENTIRYRLGRIEELSGLAVAHDPDAQLQARLSMLVLQLQGRVGEASERRPTAPVTPRALEVVAAGTR